MKISVCRPRAIPAASRRREPDAYDERAHGSRRCAPEGSRVDAGAAVRDRAARGSRSRTPSTRTDGRRDVVLPEPEAEPTGPPRRVVCRRRRRSTPRRREGHAGDRAGDDHNRGGTDSGRGAGPCSPRGGSRRRADDARLDHHAAVARDHGYAEVRDPPPDVDAIDDLASGAGGPGRQLGRGGRRDSDTRTRAPRRATCSPRTRPDGASATFRSSGSRGRSTRIQNGILRRVPSRERIDEAGHFTLAGVARDDHADPKRAGHGRLSRKRERCVGDAGDARSRRLRLRLHPPGSQFVAQSRPV